MFQRVLSCFFVIFLVLLLLLLLLVLLVFLLSGGGLLLGGDSAFRQVLVVGESGLQPTLNLGDGHLLAGGIVLDLIAAELVGGEVLGLGVGEHQSRDGGGGGHGHVLGQVDLCNEETKKE